MMYLADEGPRGTTFCVRCLVSFATGCERQHEAQNPRRHPPAGTHACRIFTYFGAGNLVTRTCSECRAEERGRWVRIVDQPDSDH